MLIIRVGILTSMHECDKATWVRIIDRVWFPSDVQVRDKYLSKYTERQRQAMLSVTTYRNDLQKLSDQFRLRNEEKWYRNLIDEIRVRGEPEYITSALNLSEI